MKIQNKSLRSFLSHLALVLVGVFMVRQPEIGQILGLVIALLAVWPAMGHGSIVLTRFNSYLDTVGPRRVRSNREVSHG
jgi:hypothetical protein